MYRTFQFGSFLISPSVRRSFSLRDRLYIYFKIKGLNENLKKRGKLEFSFFKEDRRVHIFERRMVEYRDPENFLEHL